MALYCKSAPGGAVSICSDWNEFGFQPLQSIFRIKSIKVWVSSNFNSCWNGIFGQRHVTMVFSVTHGGGVILNTLAQYYRSLRFLWGTKLLILSDIRQTQAKPANTPGFCSDKFIVYKCKWGSGTYDMPSTLTPIKKPHTQLWIFEIPTNIELVLELKRSLSIRRVG